MEQQTTVGPKDKDWSLEWPTEPGWYWFYGNQFTPRSDSKSRLYVVNAIRAGQGPSEHIMYVSNGGFMYKEEGAQGVWQLIPNPTLPNTGSLSDLDQKEIHK